MEQDDTLLSTKLLSRRWNIAPRTLERWRAEGRGPQFVRIGRHVRYRQTDIQAFEAKHIKTAGPVPTLAVVECAA
ncbi:helix-turn-helix domain-containing protein [Ruegeria sp. 1NDH52C]|uniref:Helix-turn-helix domain-containing protein n=1 Tax=Ruegeria alba TaxID=2916756 RepID=A0ABS9NTU0_9RHOB|nr:helix-turn-helix domain-containing protein [Ruegeria alba]MCG6557637.1 helix-turn-helix domain-containing protein [Ruegeria alba]